MIYTKSLRDKSRYMMHAASNMKNYLMEFNGWPLDIYDDLFDINV